MARKPGSGGNDEHDQPLPVLVDGELAEIRSVQVVEKKTRPPVPYTEGTLIEDMRNAGKFLQDAELKRILKQVSGLGTSATRDSILEALKHHQYLVRQGKHLVATPKGLAFIQWLEQGCPELVDVANTAHWEAQLDGIAQRGGGAAFERAIAAQVTQLVATLKSHPPMPRPDGAASPKEQSSMSDTNNAGRGNPPTEKMLAFAQDIAKRLEMPLPAEAPDSFDACRAFIDTHKDLPAKNGSGTTAPTEKQLSFADSIARKRGLTIPPEARTDRRALSAWIDANKG